MLQRSRERPLDGKRKAPAWIEPQIIAEIGEGNEASQRVIAVGAAAKNFEREIDLSAGGGSAHANAANLVGRRRNASGNRIGHLLSAAGVWPVREPSSDARVVGSSFKPDSSFFLILVSSS